MYTISCKYISVKYLPSSGASGLIITNVAFGKFIEVIAGCPAAQQKNSCIPFEWCNSLQTGGSYPVQSLGGRLFK